MQHGNEAEQRAASLTLAHSNTPQIIDLDTLGRPFKVSDDAGGGSRFITHNHIDIAGLTVKVTDALGRDMTFHVYDTTGQLFYTFNIDSGHRWMLVNAMDMPVYLWDSRRNKIELSYDELLRPTGTKLNEDGSQSSKLVEVIEYGTDASSYTIGRPVNQKDQSGQLLNKTYDFKGNPLEIKRLLLQQFQGTIDWREEQVFETFELLSQFTYDALNRPVSETDPEGKTRNFFYNKAGLLEQLEFDREQYITNINYNEKGQRTNIYFGNNSKTRYDYDPLNFSLTRLLTTRNTGQEILQDLNYTYDPEGNIVQQTDNAQQDLYFGNEVIRPTGRYEYDALYRLTKAEGRELAGLNMPDYRDFSNEILLPDSNSPQNYSHTYTYDALGNIRQLMSISRWRRDYQYGTTDNRLLGIEGEHFEYRYDAHGNLLAMPHLETMTWDYNDRLSSSAINRDQQTWYRYDAGGNRTRKITQSGPHLLKERIYFTNFEIYRERSMDGEIITERLTNLITDGNKRIAMVDSLTIEQGHPIEPKTTVRYQYDNHLGSACLELDERAEIISYEEYHPFGTTSYRSGRSSTETSLKRYKYVGKERDEETGLYYYGARYYAAWLCRFVSVDPIQFDYPELTPYQYASNRPITMIDLDGLEGVKSKSLSTEEIMLQGMLRAIEVSNTRDNIPDNNSYNPRIAQVKIGEKNLNQDNGVSYSMTIVTDVAPKAASLITKEKYNNKADDIELKNEQTGRKVTNFGGETQSPRKSANTNNWIDKGWNSKRGPVTTRGMGYATNDVLKFRQIARNADDFLGPFGDVIDLIGVLNNNQSVFSAINPFSFMVDEIHQNIDQEMFELAVSGGYKSVKSLMENCSSCQEMFSDMILQYLTSDELSMLAQGKINNMSSFQLQSRNETMGYAALIHVGDNGSIVPMAYFSTNK